MSLSRAAAAKQTEGGPKGTVSSARLRLLVPPASVVPASDSANPAFCTLYSAHREKEMATHSRILAWEIPRTEEPGGPQSMGCKSQTRLGE